MQFPLAAIRCGGDGIEVNQLELISGILCGPKNRYYVYCDPTQVVKRPEADAAKANTTADPDLFIDVTIVAPKDGETFTCACPKD